MAVMPFIQFPTAAGAIGGVNDVEGGIIFPMAVSLPREWTLGLMAEIDFLRDEADEGYGTAFVQTATISHGSHSATPTAVTEADSAMNTGHQLCGL